MFKVSFVNSSSVILLCFSLASAPRSTFNICSLQRDFLSSLTPVGRKCEILTFNRILFQLHHTVRSEGFLLSLGKADGENP